MDRYGSYETTVWKDDEGEYVLHSEAQAEIARLQAEVERLTKAHDAASDRAMRSDMRLITARNDALDAALEALPQDKWGGDYECGWRVALGESAEAIRALKDKP